MSRDSVEYEFYAVTVRRVGSAKMVGSKRIMCEDGVVFANLEDAGAHLARRAGFALDAGRLPKKWLGQEILAAGKWYEFCAERKLDPGAISNLQEQFVITWEEATRLGLT